MPQCSSTTHQSPDGEAFQCHSTQQCPVERHTSAVALLNSVPLERHPSAVALSSLLLERHPGAVALLNSVLLESHPSAVAIPRGTDQRSGFKADRSGACWLPSSTGSPMQAWVSARRLPPVREAAASIPTHNTPSQAALPRTG